MKELVARALQLTLVWLAVTYWAPVVEEAAPEVPGFVFEVAVGFFSFLVSEVLALYFAIPQLTLDWREVGRPLVRDKLEASASRLDGGAIYFELAPSVRYRSVLYKFVLASAVKHGFFVRIYAAHAPVMFIVDICEEEPNGETPMRNELPNDDGFQFHPQLPIPKTETSRWCWAKLALVLNANPTLDEFDMTFERRAKNKRGRLLSRFIRIKSSAAKLYVYE